MRRKKVVCIFRSSKLGVKSTQKPAPPAIRDDPSDEQNIYFHFSVYSQRNKTKILTTPKNF